MSNLFNFILGAAVGAGALTLCALYDDDKGYGKQASRYSDNDSVSDEELDAIIEETDRDIKRMDKLQQQFDECMAEQDQISENDPEALEKELAILDRQSKLLKELV